jgi:hypothetical protein
MVPDGCSVCPQVMAVVCDSCIYPPWQLTSLITVEPPFDPLWNSFSIVSVLELVSGCDVPARLAPLPAFLGGSDRVGTFESKILSDICGYGPCIDHGRRCASFNETRSSSSLRDECFPASSFRGPSRHHRFFPIVLYSDP